MKEGVLRQGPPVEYGGKRDESFENKPARRESVGRGKAKVGSGI